MNVTFPQLTWKHYHKFVTEKELILLGHFSLYEKHTKKLWLQIATEMGYKNHAPVRSMVGRLVEKGVLIIDKYTVVSNLNSLCENYEKDPDSVVVSEKKNTGDNTHYVLASELIDEFSLAVSKHGLATRVKNLLGKGLTPDDIHGMVVWMDACNTEFAEKRGIPKRPVSYSAITTDNFYIWAKKGRPTSKQKKIFSDI